MNTTFVSRLLTIERVTLSNLHNAWGAGYEIAFFNGSSFKKIDNIAYVISHGEFNSTGDIGIPIPRLILYYNYYNDNLIITSVELYDITRSDSDAHMHFESTKFSVNVFLVPSIECKESDPPIEIPDDFSFSSSFSVSVGYGIILHHPTVFTTLHSIPLVKMLL